MNILALDPAKETGAAHHPSGLLEIWQLQAHPEQHRGIAFTILREMILYVNDQHGPLELLAFEDAAQAARRQYSTREYLTQLQGVIIMTAADLAIPFQSFNPSTIKKFATNNGRADKSQMMHACSTQLGIAVSDDNAADALWILELAKHRNEKSLPFR